MRGAIVGMGGGGFSEEPDNPLLDRFVLGLAGRDGAVDERALATRYLG